MVNASFTLIFLPILIRLSFTQQLILKVVLWLSFHGESQPEPNQSAKFREPLADLRERIDYLGEEERKIFRASEGIEAQFRKGATQRAYRDQEDAKDPMAAPQDYDVHQSVRVLGLQNSDLWLRPTDLSWHFPVLMTIREGIVQELSFENRRKVEGQGELRPKSSRSRRCRHHLGHGTDGLGAIIEFGRNA